MSSSGGGGFVFAGAGRERESPERPRLVLRWGDSGPTGWEAISEFDARLHQFDAFSRVHLK